MQKQTPKTQAQAIIYAIAWQQWAGRQSLSYGELAEWQQHFEEIAQEFDLLDEFHENGIL